MASAEASTLLNRSWSSHIALKIYVWLFGGGWDLTGHLCSWNICFKNSTSFRRGPVDLSAYQVKSSWRGWVSLGDADLPSPLQQWSPTLGLHMFFNYNSQKPSPLLLLARITGSWSPKTSGGPRLMTTALEEMTTGSSELCHPEKANYDIFGFRRGAPYFSEDIQLSHCSALYLSFMQGL